MATGDLVSGVWMTIVGAVNLLEAVLWLLWLFGKIEVKWV